MEGWSGNPLYYSLLYGSISLKRASYSNSTYEAGFDHYYIAWISPNHNKQNPNKHTKKPNEQKHKQQELEPLSRYLWHTLICTFYQ